MKDVIVNGTTYSGVSTVQLNTSSGSPATFIDQDEATGTVVLGSVSGKVIHVTDAVPTGVKSLKVYDANGNEFTNAVTLAIANKNLFRIDLLNATTVSQGITFTKNADGSITANGTSTGTYASARVTLDKNIFVTGQVFTMSSGKTSGELYVQLALSYSDGSTDYLVSRNSYTVFMVPKTVVAAAASVQITNSGVTLNNETIYPMIELSGTPSAFENNTYTTMSYDGTTMPTLPDAVSNIWSNADTVATLAMVYSQDVAAQADHLQSQNDATSSALISLDNKVDNISPAISAQGETMMILAEGIETNEETLLIR